jgi:hypothetical protein
VGANQCCSDCPAVQRTGASDAAAHAHKQYTAGGLGGDIIQNARGVSRWHLALRELSISLSEPLRDSCVAFFVMCRRVCTRDKHTSPGVHAQRTDLQFLLDVRHPGCAAISATVRPRSEQCFTFFARKAAEKDVSDARNDCAYPTVNFVQ